MQKALRLSRLGAVQRGAIVRLVAVAVVMAGIAIAFALGFHWLPDANSRQAGRIHFVFWFVTIICIAIFTLVTSVIAYSVVKFRKQPDDDSDGPPIHGHTGLEIVWTLVPTVLVTAISVVSAIVLAKNGDAGRNPLRINVTAQQFAWSFSYPEANNLQSAVLRLPIDRAVKLTFHSEDVIHSFWVPEFSQKQDVVPGITTDVVITPDKLGTFDVVCTELCGLGHALMRSSVIVMSASDFDSWLKKEQGSLNGPPGQAGKTVFTNNGCAGCHTFKPAGATGKVGPDLDNLQAAAQKAGKPLQDFVRESIVDPNAYIAPGYHPNVMPTTFKSLPKEQLDALVQYLTGGAK
jgi:cytochrome c oxidase subunit II